MQRAMKIFLYINRLANEVGTNSFLSDLCLTQNTGVNSAVLSGGDKVQRMSTGSTGGVHKWEWDISVTQQLERSSYEWESTGVCVLTSECLWRQSWMRVIWFREKRRGEEKMDLNVCLLTEGRCSKQNQCHRLSWGWKHVINKFTDVRKNDLTPSCWLSTRWKQFISNRRHLLAAKQNTQYLWKWALLSALILKNIIFY